MDNLAYPEDCGVERSIEAYPGFALMMDCDGNTIFMVPDSWTDEQMFVVLNIANGAFAKGVKCGRIEKAHQIKSAIESA